MSPGSAIATTRAVGLAPMAATSATLEAIALKPRSKPEDHSSLKS